MVVLLTTPFRRQSTGFLTSLYFTSLTFLYFTTVSTALRIEVTAPVNPVRVNGVVSVHCQIWDLPPGHEVTLSRRTGTKTERLAWNGDIQTSVPDRVFLAVRVLDDGSTVFFLTLMEVVKEDKGTYNCTVLSDTYQKVAEGFIKLNVQYFPMESYPTCTPTSVQPIAEGTELVLNCTSEAANPAVSLQWSRTGGSKLSSETLIRNGVVYNEIRVRPSLADDGALYMCNIKSSAFPLEDSSCHVGPITVTRNRLNPIPPPGTVNTKHPDNDVMTYPSDASDGTISDQTDPIRNKTANLMDQCKDACSTTHMNVMFWIICTIVAAFCACIFLIIGITLIVKTRQLPRYQYPDVKVKEDQHHQVYVELHKRQQMQQQNRSGLYMDLTRIDMDNRENRMMYIRKPSDQTYSDTVAPTES